MKLEIIGIINHTLSEITTTQLNPKNPNLLKKNPEKHWKPRSASKTPGLASLAKSFWK